MSICAGIFKENPISEINSIFELADLELDILGLKLDSKFDQLIFENMTSEEKLKLYVEEVSYRFRNAYEI